LAKNREIKEVEEICFDKKAKRQMIKGEKSIIFLF
jgi:hypothetical protein